MMENPHFSYIFPKPSTLCFLTFHATSLRRICSKSLIINILRTLCIKNAVDLSVKKGALYD